MDPYNEGAYLRGMVLPTDDGGIKAPGNVIYSLSTAWMQYQAVRQASLGRILLYASIYAMISGNPPYDQAMLKANGLDYVTNFNNFKARSGFEQAAQGIWNLLNSTDVFLKVVLQKNFPDGTKWARIIAKNFSDVMKMWPDFESNFNLLGTQLVLYGICPVFFPHEESPLWEVVDVSRFFIPTDTQVFTSKLSNVSIETTYNIQHLFQIYESAADDGPWNKQALANFLLMRANVVTSNTFNFTNLLDVTRYIAAGNGPLNTYYTDTVRLVNMYQKEYDGKVSHYIFASDQYPSPTTAGPVPDSQFLYFADRKYASIDEAIVILTYSPGEWLIHDNIGVGQKMYAQAQAVNMLDCSVVDMARTASTPIIRSLATGGRQTEPIRFIPGVVTDVGAAEFVQNNIGANIDQVLGASAYLSSNLRSNAIMSGDDSSRPDLMSGSLPANEVRGKDFKEFGVMRNVVEHLYNGLDKIIRLCFIRLLKVKEKEPGYDLKKEFLARCKEDGVPDELLATSPLGLQGLPRQFRSVSASRVAGNGSTYARILGLESLDRIVPMFNAEELQAYKQEWIESTLGADYIPTFAPDDGVPDELSGGASLARVENGLMKLGQAPLFSPDNDQAAHADEHMGLGSQTVQAVSQQQMSPIDAAKIMELLIPHLTETIQFMNRSPLFYRDVLSKIEKPFKQLVQWAQLNKRNAESMIQAAIRKQQEDQAATQQVMTDAQRKDFQAQRDAERSDYKVQQQVERAKDANETRAEIMKEKTDADIENNRRKTEADVEAKRGATAKGRAQTELENTPVADLQGQLRTMNGITPSTVDFEG